MPVSPIWPAGSAVNDEGEITFHGRTAASLLDEFGSPLYVIDTDDVRARATKFVHAASHAFNNTVTHVSFAGKALLSKEICRIVTESGMLIDTCTMGEMRIALAAGVPGRRLVLHGNNKSDAEIELAIEQGFNKIVIDEPDEPARIAAMAKRLATDTGSSVVDRALQLHGGYGYLMDYPIERFWRDLRVHSILEGTNQVMRMIVGRELTRQ